jgi:hypothetical protein
MIRARILLSFFFVLYWGNLNAQVDSSKVHHWNFRLYGTYYFGQNLDNHSSGYTDVRILATFLPEMEIAYQYRFNPFMYLEGDVFYRPTKLSYKANYDFRYFTEGGYSLNEGAVTEQIHHYRREQVGTSISLGYKYQLTKHWNYYASVGLSFSHFLQSRQTKTSYAISVRDTAGINFQKIYFAEEVDLAGGSKKHFNERLYFVPQLKFVLGLGWAPQRLKGRRFNLLLKYSCVCLTEEPEGTIDFYYFNENQEEIGQVSYESRLRHLSLGIGLSF